MSPFPPPLPSKSDLVYSPPDDKSSISSDQSKQPKQPQLTIPATPSNSIYIGTSSVDGNVCVTSLVDPKDVVIRNFGRPIEAVALSPEYKSDRTYLSGGRAGSLVLTIGGRIGTTSNSTIMGTSSNAASGWLGTLGLSGNNSGKDTILHSGEGAISSIKWSRSGKYVAWANEEGIKIMRSHLHLDHGESENSWERFCHIDRPRSQMWDEMASVWKARIEWVDEDALCLESADSQEPNVDTRRNSIKNGQPERLLIGWGGTIWIVGVSPGDLENGVGRDRIGIPKISTKFVKSPCFLYPALYANLN